MNYRWLVLPALCLVSEIGNAEQLQYSQTEKGYILELLEKTPLPYSRTVWKPYADCLESQSLATAKAIELGEEQTRVFLSDIERYMVHFENIGHYLDAETADIIDRQVVSPCMTEHPLHAGNPLLSEVDATLAVASDHGAMPARNDRATPLAAIPASPESMSHRR